MSRLTQKVLEKECIPMGIRYCRKQKGGGITLKMRRYTSSLEFLQKYVNGCGNRLRKRLRRWDINKPNTGCS